MSQIIKERFSCHMGYNFSQNKPNSLNAIKAAVEQNPLFVEFDITYQNGNIKTGHPPQERLDPLEDVLKVFRGSKTFPKLDLKLGQTNDDFTLIDAVIKLVGQLDIPFALFSMSNAWIRGGGGWKKEKNREKLIQSYRYCADKIKGNPRIKLSFEIAKIKKYDKEFVDKKIKNHIEYLAQTLYCLALEIHQGNWKESVQVAQEFNIPNIQFWLTGWPDVSNPQVSKSTIFKALELEDQYPIKVYFDINPEYIVE
ncbi:hypothetical protein MYX06_03835 [Patescibacteria group bacterium AH-259-L05]|nr:hypothetical protein [Patescibacteria group bacterium AH-259-L05]